MIASSLDLISSKIHGSATLDINLKGSFAILACRSRASVKGICLAGCKSGESQLEASCVLAGVEDEIKRIAVVRVCFCDEHVAEGNTVQNRTFEDTLKRAFGDHFSPILVAPNTRLQRRTLLKSAEAIVPVRARLCSHDRIVCFIELAQQLITDGLVAIFGRGCSENPPDRSCA